MPILLSLDWFKGKYARNHGFYHWIWGFPVNVPLNQSNDIRIYPEWNPMTIPWKTHLRKPSPGPKGEAQRLNEAMGSSHCVAWSKERGIIYGGLWGFNSSNHQIPGDIVDHSWSTIIGWWFSGIKIRPLLIGFTSTNKFIGMMNDPE